jgi:FlaA1/EpsC-like NDP-sugar epimerase
MDATLLVLALWLSRLSGVGNKVHASPRGFGQAAALTVVLQLAALVLVGSYRSRWGISNFKQSFPMLRGSLLAVCFVALLVLSAFPGMTAAFILLDGALATVLLVIGRTANGFFDHLLDRAPGGPAMQQTFTGFEQGQAGATGSSDHRGFVAVGVSAERGDNAGV